MSDPPIPLAPQPAARQPIYVVAGGNHVTIQLDRAATGGALDAIEVLAGPGGGPPAHSHAFAEWFRVLEGELTICEDRDGTVVCTQVLRTGDALYVPPWIVHATLNLSRGATRFQVVGQPGLMSAYFAQAGVPVADETAAADRVPPGPPELAEIAARWGIEFWSGPVDRTPVS